MRTTQFLCLLIISLFSLQLLNAQSSSVYGVILDEKGEGLPFATAILQSASDSSMVKGEVTDDAGQFRISGIESGSYFLKCTFVGYTSYYTDVFMLSTTEEKNLGELKFSDASVELGEVEVSAARPLIEVQPDKTVFNVDGSINATGNTALELLKKSPGVVVDNNNDILLTGKSGVQVYIDGKPSYMSGEDLALRLEAMQSSEIDAIEIITEPGARYDAEGNAGIINIRMKKDISLGTNATINLGANYGKYWKYNGGINANYRNKKINVFGNYNGNDGIYESWFDFYRLQDNIEYSTISTLQRSGGYHSAKLGLDHFINDKQTIGFIVNGYFDPGRLEGTSRTPINVLNGEDISVLYANSIAESLKTNFNTNLNYQYNVGEKSTLNLDLDYGRFDNSNDATQPNYYTFPGSETPQNVRQFDNEDTTSIKIYTAKADYEMPAFKGLLGFGLKVSQVTTDNSYNAYLVEDGSSTLDINRSADFRFTENINAAYLSYGQDLSQKLKVNAGLRAEQTNSRGTLTALVPTENDDVPRSYLDLFPSLSFSYALNQTNQLKLSYNRRINRPRYQDLNPFEFQLNELSFARGNPFVNPQYAHNISLAHTFMYRFTTTLSFTHINDFYAQLSDSLGTDKTFLQPVNLDYQRVLNLGLSIPVSPRNWWNTYTNVNAGTKRNFADFGGGRLIDISAASLQLYHQSTFLLPKDFALELSGWFGSPSIWGALYETDTNWSIDAGIKKKLAGGKGNVKLAYTDLFNTAPWRGTQSFAGFYSDAQGGWESQQIRLNFSWLLGNDKVKASRKRATGLEDELERTKGGN